MPDLYTPEKARTTMVRALARACCRVRHQTYPPCPDCRVRAAKWTVPVGRALLDLELNGSKRFLTDEEAERVGRAVELFEVLAREPAEATG